MFTTFQEHIYVLFLLVGRKAELFVDMTQIMLLNGKDIDLLTGTIPETQFPYSQHSTHELVIPAEQIRIKERINLFLAWSSRSTVVFIDVEGALIIKLASTRKVSAFKGK